MKRRLGLSARLAQEARDVEAVFLRDEWRSEQVYNFDYKRLHGVLGEASKAVLKHRQALESIRRARDVHAERAHLGWPASVLTGDGAIELGVPRPRQDQAFDDWAADVASWALNEAPYVRGIGWDVFSTDTADEEHDPLEVQRMDDPAAFLELDLARRSISTGGLNMLRYQMAQDWEGRFYYIDLHTWREA